MTRSVPSPPESLPERTPSLDLGLFAALPVPATLVDEEGIILDVNDAFLEYAAARHRSTLREARIGHRIGEFASTSQNRRNIESFVARLFADGERLVERHHVGSWDGTRFVELAGSVVSHPDGRVGLLMLRDITDEIRDPLRGEVLAELRRVVWEMNSSQDVEAVIQQVREGLTRCGVQHYGCGVNVLDPADPAGAVRVFAMVQDREDVWKTEEKEGARLIHQFLADGLTVYRRDLLADDALDETKRLHRRVLVRSVLDVPFRRGTLAVNSLEPDAFSPSDVALIEDMATALSEGFARAEDLESIESQRAEQLQLALLREEVWKIRAPADVNAVFHAMRSALRTAGLPFERLTLYDLGEKGADGDVVRAHDASLFGGWETEVARRQLILDTWSGREVVWAPTPRHRPPAWREQAPLYGALLVVPFSRGVLVVHLPEGPPIQAPKRDFVGRLCEVIAEALRRMEEAATTVAHVHEVEEKTRLLSAWHEIARSALTSLELDEILDKLAVQIVRAGIFRSLSVSLVDHGAGTVTLVRRIHTGQVARIDVAADHGADLQRYDRVYALDGDDMTATVARDGRLQVVEGWHEHFDPVTERSGQLSYFIPVTHHDRVVAVLGTGSTVTERRPTLAAIETMSPLLDQVAAVLDHARLHREVSSRSVELAAANAQLGQQLVERERQERQRHAVHQVREQVWRMRGAAELDLVLVSVREALEALSVPFDQFSINVVREDGRVPVVEMHNVSRDGPIRSCTTLPDHPAVARVRACWRRDQPSLRDLTSLVEERDFIEPAFDHRVLTALDVPFSHGTLGICSRQRHAFADGEAVDVLQELAAALSEGFQRADDLDRLEHSEEIYRYLSEVAADMFFEIAVDPDGELRTVWTSPRFDEFLHVDLERENSDRSMGRFVLPADMPQVEERWRGLLRVEHLRVPNPRRPRPSALAAIVGAARMERDREPGRARLRSPAGYHGREKRRGAATGGRARFCAALRPPPGG